MFQLYWGIYGFTMEAGIITILVRFKNIGSISCLRLKCRHLCSLEQEMMLVQPENQKRLIALAMILVIASWLLASSGTNANIEADSKVFTADSFAMGTVISQKVYGEDGQAAVDEAIAKISYLDGLLTFYDSQGDIYRLNKNAGNGLVKLDPETIRIIEKAQQVAALSGGTFDITVGPLVKAWGIGTDGERIPSSQELHALLPLIDYQKVAIDDNSVSIKRGQMVDLGGIGKGYAGDAVIEVYKRHGIASAYVNLGGNVVTLGSKPDGSPWRVGIRDPRPPIDGLAHDLGIVAVVDKAVVTAGDDQRYFLAGGQRYHHILDPATGYPARSDLMSVTLVTDSSLDADALDTAVYILGLDKGRELLRQYGGVEAIFVTTDKKVYVTDGLKANFEFLGAGNGYVYQP